MKEVSLIGLDSVLVARLNKMDFTFLNVCRISCLDILITNDDSGLRRKRSGVRFLRNEPKNGHKNTLYACVYAYAYVTALLTSA